MQRVTFRRHNQAGLSCVFSLLVVLLLFAGELQGQNHIAVEQSTVQRDSNGKIKRSGAAKGAFKRQHPCPANGKTSGSCPGYVIDHVIPLECRGADDPSNMQWQTVADGKAKDKTEKYCVQ